MKTEDEDEQAPASRGQDEDVERKPLFEADSEKMLYEFIEMAATASFHRLFVNRGK